MTMTPELKILILDDAQQDHWEQSTKVIQSVLASAAQRYLPNVRIDILIEKPPYPNLTNKTMDSDRCSMCFIAHPTETIMKAIKYLPLQAQWILVSGGSRSVNGSPLQEIRSSDLVWFEGVYGREANFDPWLKEWGAWDFSHDKFKDSVDALISGKSGIGIVATRLQKNLTPVLMILEAFQASTNKLAESCSQDVTSTRHDMTHWLKVNLQRLWEEELVFRNLSKDASLIHGAIRNSKREDATEHRELADLLALFLPSYGFHVEYEPELDESIRKLIHMQDISWDAAIDSVSKWCSQVSRLSKLLQNVPDRF